MSTFSSNFLAVIKEFRLNIAPLSVVIAFIVMLIFSFIVNFAMSFIPLKYLKHLKLLKKELKFVDEIKSATIDWHSEQLVELTKRMINIKANILAITLFVSETANKKVILPDQTLGIWQQEMAEKLADYKKTITSEAELAIYQEFLDNFIELKAYFWEVNHYSPEFRKNIGKSQKRMAILAIIILVFCLIFTLIFYGIDLLTGSLVAKASIDNLFELARTSSPILLGASITIYGLLFNKLNNNDNAIKIKLDNMHWYLWQQGLLLLGIFVNYVFYSPLIELLIERGVNFYISYFVSFFVTAYLFFLLVVNLYRLIHDVHQDNLPSF